MACQFFTVRLIVMLVEADVLNAVTVMGVVPRGVIEGEVEPQPERPRETAAKSTDSATDLRKRRLRDRIKPGTIRNAARTSPLSPLSLSSEVTGGGDVGVGTFT
jgi:hypothetical protein